MEQGGQTNMMKLSTITQNWEALYNAQLHPIETETQYLEMLNFMRDLMRQYNITLEPHRSLWRLAAQYIADWEAANDDMATETVRGFELMRAIQDNNNFTQQEMADKLEINQSNYSRILRGERPISRKLATKLEKLFRVPADQFIN
jgi:antitoxin component HigA of HigAB toxin-antitoxin module